MERAASFLRLAEKGSCIREIYYRGFVPNRGVVESQDDGKNMKIVKKKRKKK